MGFSSVWLVLGSDELGGRRDEAEGETGRILPGPRQFRPPIHPEPQLQVAGSHTPHTHGALPRWDTHTHAHTQTFPCIYIYICSPTLTLLALTVIIYSLILNINADSMVHVILYHGYPHRWTFTHMRIQFVHTVIHFELQTYADDKIYIMQTVLAMEGVILA